MKIYNFFNGQGDKYSKYEEGEKYLDEQLCNQKLIEQCNRIRDLISKTALAEYGQKIYGARYHEYKLMKPVQIEEVREYEKEHGIVLPVEYVYFITLVGRGGAGPGNGFIRGFPGGLKGKEDELSLVSEQLSYKMTDNEWYAKFGYDAPDIPDEEYIRRDAGTFMLTGMDTIFCAHLIVTGKEAGKVVYLDWEDLYPPIWPKSCSNFLDWCENWFSEILAGYKVCPGAFMTTEIGTENNLIKSFNNHEEEKYREEVLYSFMKFTSLSNNTIQFLRDKKVYFKKPVEEVFKSFGLKGF